MKAMYIIIAAISFLGGCRYIDYRTADGRRLTVCAIGTDSTIGSLNATAGDTHIQVERYNSQVDPATIKTIDDALALAIQLLAKVPIVAAKEPIKEAK